MKRLFLRFLRISERPAPPPNAGEAFELFNPSKRLLLLHWMRWTFRQFWALVGVVFSLAFLGTVDLPETLDAVSSIAERARSEMAFDEEIELRTDALNFSTDIKLGELLRWIETIAIVGFLIQLLVSGFLVKLRWEMHWYMVSDRILGIRKGLGTVHEQTMTIANVQNMKIRQGPLQRLFGISDLEVHTAGGSSSTPADGKQGGNQLHVGRFEGLDDAEGLRRTIRTTLARTKTAGLGDPDDEGELVEDGVLAEHQAVPQRAAGRTAAEPGLVLEARQFKEEVQRARFAAESALERLSL